MKKITLLAMVLVLCLAAIGVGYAKWTDTIHLEGTVDTGDVSLEIVRTSGTWVYKCPPHDIQVVHAWDDECVVVCENATEIASAEVVCVSADNKTATLVWDNIFPLGECEAFCIDLLLHYTGSIPGRIAEINFTLDEGSDPLVVDLYHGATMARCDPDGFLIDQWGGLIYPPPNKLSAWETLHSPEIGEVVFVDIGTQLHYCDYIYAVVALQVPQDNDYMNLSGSATLDIVVEQWAEVPCDD